MNFTIIMLNQSSQMQESTYCMILPNESLEKTHLIYYLIEQIGSSLGLRLRKGNGTEA